ncbi:MAG: hypothetical protein ABIG64_07025 [Candidatus Omnitrophota bacterium]
MAQPKRTSEDRLLEIIENPATPLKKVPRSYSKSGIKQQINLLLKRIPLKKETLLKLLNFQVLNKILIFICVSLTIFFVVDFQRTKINLEKNLKNQDINAQSLYIQQAQDNILPVDFNKMIEYANMRNIFTFLLPVKHVETGEDVSQEYQELSKLIANFVLVGIIWSEENPQAIIEDKKTERTYLIEAGSKLEEFDVQKVFSDSVVVSVGENEWTIK